MSNFIKGLSIVFRHPVNRKHWLRTVSKILFWKYNQLFIKLPTVITFPSGVKCLCYPDSSYSGLVFYLEYPEYELMKLLENSIKARHVFIDIGANIGLMSLIAASKTKKPSYAFEADPRVLPRLKTNIALNDFQNKIVVVNQAVSNKKGKLSFILENHSEISHIQYPRQSLHSNRHKTVGAVRLDDFISSKVIKDRLVVKIDVEGAELLVLKGMKKLFLGHQVDLLFFEINKNCQQYGYQPKEAIAYLKSFDYEVFSLEPVKRATAKTVFSFVQHSSFNFVAAPKAKLSRKVIQTLIRKA